MKPFQPVHEMEKTVS